MSERRCPGCNGPISRGAELCHLCRPRAIAVGVNLLAPGVRAEAPDPLVGPRTSGQNRAYHGKCNRLARLRGQSEREVKQWAREHAAATFGRELESSSQLNEDEMSWILDRLDDAIVDAESSS